MPCRFVLYLNQKGLHDKMDALEWNKYPSIDVDEKTVRKIKAMLLNKKTLLIWGSSKKTLE